jgi:hypothetical protein
VIALVVGVIVVVAIFATGIYPHSGPSNSTTPAYSAAASTGRTSANSVSGAPWSLVAAVGIASQAGITFPVPSNPSSNCSFSPVLSGSIPPIDIPAYSDFSSGLSPWWGLVFVNESAHAALVVEVVNGAASPVGRVSGACVAALSDAHAISSGVVDSPTIASSIWGNGASAFVSSYNSNHPGGSLNLAMALYGGGSLNDSLSSSLSLGASWLYVITPCGLEGQGGLSGSQPAYVSIANATTGSIELADSTTVSCSNATGFTVFGMSFAPRDGALSLPDPVVPGTTSIRSLAP